MKQSWRTALAKQETPNQDFKRFKTESGVELPNRAEFTGDKLPGGKDPAKKEVSDFKAGNSLMQKDRKREESNSAPGSALMSEKAKRDNIRKHISKEDVKEVATYARKKTAYDYKLDQEFQRGDYRKGKRGVPGQESRPEFDAISDRLGEVVVKLYTYTEGKEWSNFVYRGQIDINQLRDAYIELGQIIQELKQIVPSTKTPSIWASKKTAGTHLKCPRCYYEAGEQEYTFNPGLGTSSEMKCPKCSFSFSREQGDPVDIGSYKDPTAPITSRKKSWRNILADLSFKQKPDGMVQIDITSHPGEPIAQNPNTQQPAPSSPQEMQQEQVQTGQAAEASLNKQSFAQPGQRVQNVSSGQQGTVTKVEGKDIYVNLDSGSTTVWGPNEINALAPTSPQDYGTSKFYAAAKKWGIRKEGTMSLIGTECDKFAGVVIEKDGFIVESYITKKNGHEWRELVNQPVWEAKFDAHLK